MAYARNFYDSQARRTLHIYNWRNLAPDDLQFGSATQQKLRQLAALPLLLIPLLLFASIVFSDRNLGLSATGQTIQQAATEIKPAKVSTRKNSSTPKRPVAVTSSAPAVNFYPEKASAGPTQSQDAPAPTSGAAGGTTPGSAPADSNAATPLNLGPAGVTVDTSKPSINLTVN